MKFVLNKTFRDYKGRPGINIALSHLLLEAIAGNYPNYYINWSKILISKGYLNHPISSKAIGKQRKIVFSWEMNTSLNACFYDRSVLMVYCPAARQCVYTIYGPTRNTCEATIDASDFSGETVHTYLAFISEDGKRLSNSYYTGQIKIS
jgi:hypothetical protein